MRPNCLDTCEYTCRHGLVEFLVLFSLLDAIREGFDQHLMPLGALSTAYELV